MVNEYNILNDLLNPRKQEKTKSHYSPILQGCMKNRSGGTLLRNLRILLDCGISLTIIMVKLTEKIKPDKLTETTWETQAGKFTTPKKVKVE